MFYYIRGYRNPGQTPLWFRDIMEKHAGVREMILCKHSSEVLIKFKAEKWYVESMHQIFGLEGDFFFLRRCQYLKEKSKVSAKYRLIRGCHHKVGVTEFIPPTGKAA